MSSAASVILLAAALVAGCVGLGLWVALRRPRRNLERRNRNEALAAAGRYTPAVRVSPYGSPDPRARGLSDAERVQAMRTILTRSDPPRTTVIDSPAAVHAFEQRDDPATTAPMAWQPTLPPAQSQAREQLTLS